jgi:hypothetical protein
MEGFTRAEAALLRKIAGEAAILYAEATDFRVRAMLQERERTLDVLAHKVLTAAIASEVH